MKWPGIDNGWFNALFMIIRSDEGLTLETSALNEVTNLVDVVNYQSNGLLY